MGALKLTYYEAKNPLKVVYNKTLLERKSVQRFLSVDPLADKFPHQSPFMYCSGNPVMRIDPTGRDDFEVDKKGCLSIIEKTRGNGQPDRLIAGTATYNKKGELKKSNNFIEVEKGILNDESIKDKFATEKVVGGETVPYNYTELKSDNVKEMDKLYNFLSDNTDVEWSQNVGKDGNGINSTVQTSHRDDTEIRGISNAYNRREENIVYKHSHSNAPFVMGYDNQGNVILGRSTNKPGPNDEAVHNKLRSFNPNIKLIIRNNGQNQKY